MWQQCCIAQGLFSMMGQKNTFPGKKNYILTPPSSSPSQFGSRTWLNSPRGSCKKVGEEWIQRSSSMETNEMWSCQNTYFLSFFFVQTEWIHWEHKAGERQRFELDPSFFSSKETGSDEWWARHPGLKILHCLRWLFKHLPLSSPVFETWTPGWAHHWRTAC